MSDRDKPSGTRYGLAFGDRIRVMIYAGYEERCAVTAVTADGEATRVRLPHGRGHVDLEHTVLWDQKQNRYQDGGWAMKGES